MDLCAVCHGWRSGTADPRMNQHDPRFRPTQWIMLDEVKMSYYDYDSRLFVNATTGRFLRRSLPLLRDYGLVMSTTGGFLVLVTRESATFKHASVRVLNPFTGSFICFAAPLPTGLWWFTADVVGSSPTLVLVSIEFISSPSKVYWADPPEYLFLYGGDTHQMSSKLPASDSGHQMRCR